MSFKIARTIVSLLSVIVFGTTGYAWATLSNLNSGLNTNDVIGKGLNSPDGSTDILLVGNDNRTDAQGNPLPQNVLDELRAGDNDGENTDTMILVRIPNDGKRAVAISLPRDVQLQMPDQFGKHKINSAWARGKNHEAEKLKKQGLTNPKQIEQQSTAAGQRLLVKSAEKLTGASIDHYAEVNLLGFYDITKAIGGVPVCLKHKVDDSYSGAHFHQGKQTVQGGDALAFVRQRHGLTRGDLDRVRRQQAFLAGMAQKVLSTGVLANPAKLSSLTESLQKAVVLDRGWNMIGLAQQLQGMAGGNIQFQTIPTVPDPDNGNPTVPDLDKVHAFVAGLIGQPPPPPVDGTVKASSQNAANTKVNVYNSSSESGLASRVLHRLSANGYQKGTSGNDSSHSKSVVQYAKGEAQAGQAVAQALGGLPTQQSSSQSTGSVSVYVGKDYSGPGARSLTSGQHTIQLDGHQAASPKQPAPRQTPQTGSDAISADGVPCVN